MSTRSLVGIVKEIHKSRFDSCEVVYVHSDGYPSGVGRTLLQNYAHREDVVKLLIRGGMSSLSNRMELCPFYKNEDDSSELVKYDEFEEYCGGDIEYVYLYDLSANHWMMAERKFNGNDRRRSEFTELSQSLN